MSQQFASIFAHRWVRLSGLLLALFLVSQACDPTTTPTEPTQEASSTEPTVVADATSPEPAPAEAKAKEPVPEPKPEPKPEPTATNDPYTITLFDKETIHSTGKVNVRTIKTTFKLRHTTYAKAGFFIDLESPCYPLDNPNWNNIPQGHRWPPACDAYDRNMNSTWFPPKKEGDTAPGFDLVRAITPFGGPMKVGVNITDLVNAMAKKHPLGSEHTFQLHISTYADGKGQVSGSKGSWIVSARIELTPGTPPKNVLDAIPLVNESYKHNDGSTVEKEFSIPEGTKSTKLVYSTTGHGGGTADANCIGHADEFCKRSHRVFVDGKQAKLVIPWRNDCSNFCTEVSHPRNPSFKICKENPCGSKASVRAPRANWCPGTTTYPYTWSFPEWNAPGKHTFGYSVANVAKGGSWKTSAILYVYGE